MNRDELIEVIGKVGKENIEKLADVILAMDKKEIPEWERQIDKWFSPRPFFEINFLPETGMKEYTFNGKPIKNILKSFIREEFKKMGEEIKSFYHGRAVIGQHPILNIAIKEALEKRGVR